MRFDFFRLHLYFHPESGANAKTGHISIFTAKIKCPCAKIAVSGFFILKIAVGEGRDCVEARPAK
jgi:hypothetical protein